MRVPRLFFVVAVFSCLLSFAVKADDKQPTEVVILGVDHTVQLVNPRQQPAAFRAFFSQIDPAAICIERSPERFARGNHYEFTYEIQYITVPWARENKTPLCPFDWLPEPEDTALAIGIDDLEEPPLLRNPSGFQGFLTFPDERSREAGLFFADEETERDRYRDFYVNYPDKPVADFSRRLFLYRTFMQARRIERAARNYPGQRLLVVVGVMHKDDIERILGDYPNIRIVQPSAIANEPTATEIARHQRSEDLFAIASFNLLGVEARSDATDLSWIRDVIRQLKRRNPGVETTLLATKLAELNGEIASEDALCAYEQIADTAGDDKFTWTGVKDRRRLDSFFDPFGNLTVAQRARVEMARIHYAAERAPQAEAIWNTLRADLSSSLKKAQLDGYWLVYVSPKSD